MFAFFIRVDIFLSANSFSMICEWSEGVDSLLIAGF